MAAGAQPSRLSACALLNMSDWYASVCNSHKSAKLVRIHTTYVNCSQDACIFSYWFVRHHRKLCWACWCTAQYWLAA